jgi:hypothetical protein
MLKPNLSYSNTVIINISQLIHIFAIRFSSHILPILLRTQIGLNKLAERAKGINHPKYSVKPEYACFTHESASPARHLDLLRDTDSQGNGVKKKLAEPYADTT